MNEVTTFRKQHLVSVLKDAIGLTEKQAEETIKVLTDEIISTTVRGDKINLYGFGTFEPRYRAERPGRNPKTGEEITIAASTTVGFKLSKAFKEQLNA